MHHKSFCLVVFWIFLISVSTAIADDVVEYESVTLALASNKIYSLGTTCGAKWPDSIRQTSKAREALRHINLAEIAIADEQPLVIFKGDDGASFQIAQVTEIFEPSADLLLENPELPFAATQSAGVAFNTEHAGLNWGLLDMLRERFVEHRFFSGQGIVNTVKHIIEFHFTEAGPRNLTIKSAPKNCPYRLAVPYIT